MFPIQQLYARRDVARRRVAEALPGRQRGQAVSDVVNAFDVEYAGDAFDGGDDVLELLAVADVERHFDARAGIVVAAAFKAAYIRAGIADDVGNPGDHSRPVLGEDAQAHRKFRLRGGGPFDGNAAIGFVEQIFHIRTVLAVDGDAAAAGDIADDVVAKNGVAAFRAIDHQVVVAAHHDGCVVHAEHALDGGGNFRKRFFGGRARHGLAAGLRQHLPRGPFPVTKIGVEVLDARAAVFGGHAQPLLLRNFLQADTRLPRFLLKQLAPDIGGLLTLVQMNPLADLAARARSLDEREPVARRPVSLLRDDINDVAIGDHVAQRNHLSVHLRAGALMPDLGVNGVGKINRRGAARQDDYTSLGREGVNLFGIQVHAQSGEEFAGLLHLLHPLDQVTHPDDALIVGRRPALVPALVFPVGGDTLFGDAVHLLGAYLDLEGLPGMNHRGVQRLVEVRARHCDIVLEASGDRPPDLVDDAERGVAILHRVGDHAHGQQIVNLVEIALLLLHFLMHRVEALDARLNFSGNATFDHFFANGFLDFGEEFVEGVLLIGDFFLQLKKRVGLEIAEGEVFEFAADQAHAQAVGDGRVDIERFAGDALLALGREIFERAHVVQAVGEFDHHHADVVDHGEEHLADVFGLAVFRGEQVENVR